MNGTAAAAIRAAATMALNLRVMTFSFLFRVNRALAQCGPALVAGPCTRELRRPRRQRFRVLAVFAWIAARFRKGSYRVLSLETGGRTGGRRGRGGRRFSQGSLFGVALRPQPVDLAGAVEPFVDLGLGL